MKCDSKFDWVNQTWECQLEEGHEGTHQDSVYWVTEDECKKNH